ncbi:MAG: efflux RND transporter periplasmic adaptor subunit [Pirellulales bacterium]|nr:efflux RND transporter periplasmic adaptor subunit [Pirellulales bacterium]
MSKRIGRFLGLIIVTGTALAVAITVTAGGWGRTAPIGNGTSKTNMPKTPVAVMEVKPELIEITDSYSGMIRPLERFTLGFEIAGRVVALGADAEGQPLDDGDRVTAGQVLAKLDDRVYRSRVDEAKAQLEAVRAQSRDANARLEKAQSDLNRSEQLRQLEQRTGKRAITGEEYQADVTQLSVAKAQAEMVQAQLAVALAQLPTAEKNLEDATLRSPVAGVLSKRLINVGESVTPHQVVMEIIQVDEVLLVAGVPEAYVGAIQIGQPVHVELLARDRFQQQRARSDGRVYRVAEAADQTTGLFEVEIILPNPQRRWRPGLIALAHIVLDRVQGFRVPMTCAVFRDDAAYLFTVETTGLASPDAEELGKARRLDLSRWIEQGRDLILAELPPGRRIVVQRGQHRLVDGRDVRLIRADVEGPAESDAVPAVRSPARVVNAKS